MILTLSIRDRIVFASILPKIGSMTEMHLSSVLEELISLGEHEKKEINLRKEGENILFTDTKEAYDFDLTKEQSDFLKLIVKIKDEKNQVSKEIYPLFCKINEL